MINKNGSLDSLTLKENHFGMPVNELNNSVPPQYSLLVILQDLFNKLNPKIEYIKTNRPTCAYSFVETKNKGTNTTKA